MVARPARSCRASTPVRPAWIADLRNSFGGGFLLEVFEPDLERCRCRKACRQRGRRRCQEQRAYGQGPSRKARCHRDRSLRGRRIIDISIETTSNVRGNSGQNKAAISPIAVAKCGRCRRRPTTAERAGKPPVDHRPGGLAAAMLALSAMRRPCAATETDWPGNRPQADARAARGAAAAAD